MNPRDAAHIFECLRKGLVPERGLDAYAVGMEPIRDEIGRQLSLAEAGEGTVKFLRGGYGCGKTFTARMAVLDAHARGFATSFVVVSDNDLRFHRYDEVYRKVVAELATAACPRDALGDILDRWVARVEEGLIAAGADENAPDFDTRVRDRLRDELYSRTRNQAPQDFVRVVQAIFDARQRGEFAEAGALLSWLSGSANVSASARKAAGVKGDIGSAEAMDYLRGVLEIVKAAGYRGLVIVIDEAETILRMRQDSRHKSLNGIRQICDSVGSYHGLVWLFTGTPEFFDSPRGVAGLTPLHDRIRFQKHGGFASRQQAQLELVPFDRTRLLQVAERLRAIYPHRAEGRIDERVGDGFVGRLVDEVTAGFRGDVGVVPRQFLRTFVDQLDLVAQERDYVPAEAFQFAATALTPEERHAITGEPMPEVVEPEEGLGVMKW
jgi:hypothetical protein